MGDSDPAAPGATDNPASRKLSEPIEAAIGAVVAAAAAAGQYGEPGLTVAINALRVAILAVSDDGVLVLQQLRAARQWFTFLVDELDLEPEATAYVVTAASSNDEPARELARVTLAHSLAQVDAVLAGASS